MSTFHTFPSILTYFQVFPDCYKWATYGITTLLAKTWLSEEARRNISPPPPPNPYFVEFTSILERTLAFAMTGSGKVLHRGTMAPTLLSKGLVSHAFPALHRKLWSRPDDKVSYGLMAQNWPTIEKNGFPQPVTSTLNGLKFHYSLETYWVRALNSLFIHQLQYNFKDACHSIEPRSFESDSIEIRWPFQQFHRCK
jgi:hypothetical protein